MQRCDIPSRSLVPDPDSHLPFSFIQSRNLASICCAVGTPACRLPPSLSAVGDHGNTRLRSLLFSETDLTLKPIEFTKPSSIVEQIHKSLLEAISNHELEPGTPLTEAQLQKWFGVSRAPIREAIRLLESEGLVVVNAFKKKYVRKYTSEEMLETFKVLGCLEGYAAAITATRITSEQIDFLEKNLERMQEAYSTGNLDVCSQINFEFHGTITRIAGNTVLKKIWRPSGSDLMPLT